MNHRPSTARPLTHCLLPFEAEPKVLASLRRTVRRQFGLWGASSVSDAAELAVTELAANVIRHVGAGSPATLLMEEHRGSIRIEVHDTSPVLPCCEEVCADTERGRGLSLVAAVADDWFAVSTPGGKAVCCEFALAAVELPLPRPYEHRVARGSEVVNGYVVSLAPVGTHPFGSRAAVDAVTADLITDLLHWLTANGRDPDTILDHAQTRFEAEATEGVRGSVEAPPVRT